MCIFSLRFIFFFFFFFSSRRRHTRSLRDWSSDVCSSDLGGLSSAIYNEVMQFFVILCALIPLVIVALKETGGIGGLFSKLATQGTSFTHPWAGTGLGGHNLFGDWIGIIFGLGFCLSFGYWTTNFAEV